MLALDLSSSSLSFWTEFFLAFSLVQYNTSTGKIGTFLYNRSIILHRTGVIHHAPTVGRMTASTSLPMRLTIAGKASISSREVRKLTTQARSKNVPSTTALERKASPLF